MLPSVFEMANKMAEPNIRRVMLMMSLWAIFVVSGKRLLIILGIKIKAIVASTVINIVAVVSMVFANFLASSLSFVRYSEKTGKKAAESAPAMKRLKSMSGIRKDALYASVIELVPKFVAIMRSRNSPIA